TKQTRYNHVSQHSHTITSTNTIRTIVCTSIVRFHRLGFVSVGLHKATCFSQTVLIFPIYVLFELDTTPLSVLVLTTKRVTRRPHVTERLGVRCLVCDNRTRVKLSALPYFSCPFSPCS